METWIALAFCVAASLTGDNRGVFVRFTSSMAPTICIAGGHIARWEYRYSTVFPAHSASANTDIVPNLFVKLTPPMWWVTQAWLRFARIVLVNFSIISKSEPPDDEEA